MEIVEEGLLQRLAFFCSEARQTFAQQLGMSQARMYLLSVLWRKGKLSHATLQQHLLLDGATVTRQVKQFETEGVVTRRLDPQDNRYTLVSLTPSGRELVARLNAAHQEFQGRVLEGISPEEQESILGVLERLRANIRILQEENRE